MLTEKSEPLLDARFVRELSVLRRPDAARRLAAATGDMTLARSEAGTALRGQRGARARAHAAA
jgi:hypothetical protein